MNKNFIVLILSGCVGSDDLENYRCTEEQLTILQNEIAICTDLGYRDSFCYYTIKKAQCEYVGVDYNGGLKEERL